MKKILIGISAAALLGLTSCVSYNPPGGSLFTNVTLNKEVPEKGDMGSRSGTACATGILGLISVGDGGAKAAALDGGISNVKAVDYKVMAILGSLYTRVCTVVQGD